MKARTLRRSGGVLLAAVALLGCGGEAGGPSDADRQPGRLVVEKALARGPIWIEGSVTHLRVAGPDGTEIVDEPVARDGIDAPIFDQKVPEGTYDVAAVERPCQGNCTMLDPAVEGTRCRLEVDVRPDRTSRVAIVLSDTSGVPDSRCSVTASAF